MKPITDHERLRDYIAECIPAGASLTDADIERVEVEMPVVTRAIMSRARNVDTFLRSLPDDLLSRLRLIAHDFFEWSNPFEPETWPHELTALTTMLYRGETENDQMSYEEVSFAAARLAAQTFIEYARRDGHYAFVSEYSLTSTKEPLRILARESLTEH